MILKQPSSLTIAQNLESGEYAKSEWIASRKKDVDGGE
jgi:hypothetical protein